MGYRVYFKSRGKPVYVSSGTTILAAAVESGVKIRHNCGAQATCGTCRVLILEGQDNLSRVVKREIDLLGEDRLQKGYRLACQSKIRGPIAVEITNWLSIPPRTGNLPESEFFPENEQS